MAKKVARYTNPVCKPLRLALAQIGLRVGDLYANVRQVAVHAAHARRAGADLIVFPELTLCGYLPEDLLLKRHFIDDNLVALQRAAAACRGITAIVGFVDRKDDLYNAAAVIDDGQVSLVYHKQYLPNYGVFDEARYFKPGVVAPVFVKAGIIIGVNICEDLWHAEGPATVQAIGGRADLILNLTASPYHVGKPALREAMLARRSHENGVVIAYTNQVGGQDDLIFDGGSLVYGADGRCLARGPMFEEALMIVDLADWPRLEGSHLSTPPDSHRLDPCRRTYRSEALSVPTYFLPDHRPPRRRGPPTAPAVVARLSPSAEIYRALRLGLSDYVKKNGFETVVVGLSGGIDSALVATLAADALGADHVVGIFMASRYTAKQSGEDAAALAKRLGIRLISLSIEAAFEAYLATLAPLFSGRPPDVTEENLQARIRATILMALANKFGWLLLATGNKSEISVGYATLYGDMAGGFAPIKDLWKTRVYTLARWRNRQGRPIPARILRRPPTAELRPDQTDEATLAPYAILDPILRAFVEDDKSVSEIVNLGFDRKTVTRIVALVERSEFKRRQAPIGVKISLRAFGKDRRMPITQNYAERQLRSQTL